MVYRKPGQVEPDEVKRSEGRTLEKIKDVVYPTLAIAGLLGYAGLAIASCEQNRENRETELAQNYFAYDIQNDCRGKINLLSLDGKRTSRSPSPFSYQQYEKKNLIPFAPSESLVLDRSLLVEFPLQKWYLPSAMLIAQNDVDIKDETYYFAPLQDEEALWLFKNYISKYCRKYSKSIIAPTNRP